MGSETKICIGLPTCGIMKTKTVFSILRMLKFSSFKFDIVTKESAILHWNREHIVKQAIEGRATHILFIDSDMFFEADSAMRLLERDKDIIGVPYNLHSIDPTSTLKDTDENGVKLWEQQENGLLKCAAVGTGFLLIKTSVFEKLKEPWFFWETDEKGNVVTGEDSWFCRLARQAGFEIFADTTVKVGHIGDFIY